jgi:oligopeptide/dipeptide ABC transporter ATP-binding protein
MATHTNHSETGQPTISDDTLMDTTELKKYFSTAGGLLDRVFGTADTVYAVDGVSLHIGERETLGVVGESGCGKSTLGRTMARLYKPTDGQIMFNGRDITGLSTAELKPLRKEIQFIFQDPLSSLNPRKTAGQIIAKPLTVHNIASGNERTERVIELLDEVGLNESHYDRYPHEMSGGQRQRVGIARALAVEPRLIIADEPVSALDVSVQAQILNLLDQLQDEYGLSYMVIAHDLSVVRHVSDRVAVMYLGKIVEQGPTESIFEYAQHPYTRSLLASIPSIEGDTSVKENVLEGNPPSPTDPPTGCPFHTRCPEFIGDECVDVEPALDSVEGSQGTIATTPTPGETVDEDGDKHNPAVSDASSDHVAACHWLNKDATDRRVQEPYQNTTTE